MNWFKKYWPLIAIVIFLLATRLLVTDQIYHQDEHRWAMQADPRFDESSPHPPLGKYYFRLIGLLFGFDSLRIGSFLFGLAVAFLVYLVSLEISKKRAVALWALSLYTVNIYSVIASVQVDVDGVILPFFGLLSYYSYLKVINGNKKWLLTLVAAITGGFLTKLSFILFIGAGLVNYLFFVFQGLQMSLVFDYARSFNIFNFGSRAYFDLAFKVMKSLVWLSPLLLLPTLTGLFKKDIFKKYFFWFAYLAINIIFYIVLFDFSNLTIERYFMFAIVPTALISAEVIFNLSHEHKNKKTPWLLSAIIFIGFSAIIFLPQNVLPLNPKEAYLESIKNFKFDFLIPFSGGSGPVGFYFSAQYILCVWILSLIFMLGLIFNKKYKHIFGILFVVFGIGYNLLFISEYAGGYFYGSPNDLAKKSIKYVLSDKNIKGVITYYDIGAYELKISGKYLSRFYTAPKRDYTEKLSRFQGYYMIVDFPAIDKNGRYWPLISECNKVKEFEDKYVQSYIFDCANKLF